MNRRIFVIQKCCVFFAVGTECSSIIEPSFGFKKQNSSWMEFIFVTVLPKYLNFVIFSKDLWTVFITWDYVLASRFLKNLAGGIVECFSRHAACAVLKCHWNRQSYSLNTEKITLPSASTKRQRILLNSSPTWFSYTFLIACTKVINM